jgi:hypothetical protein
MNKVGSITNAFSFSGTNTTYFQSVEYKSLVSLHPVGKSVKIYEAMLSFVMSYSINGMNQQFRNCKIDIDFGFTSGNGQFSNTLIPVALDSHFSGFSTVISNTPTTEPTSYDPIIMSRRIGGHTGTLWRPIRPVIVEPNQTFGIRIKETLDNNYPGQTASYTINGFLNLIFEEI